ncbi:SRPBCC family protein [Kangiella shandongensis]|uniref:SRPBCC family protein n=1 Tax=Kangiella shandongensis TaxID=2763258 RepID=UPI001CC1269B|nr:SRPBCC family protein [Kangiella shandongensis]
MEYQLDIVINKPLSEVVELFTNVDNLKKWQPEMVAFEHLSGELGQVGCQNKLVYLMGKRELSMIETITEQHLPERLSATYETDGVVNTVENEFKAVGAEQTYWATKNHFRFTSLGMKLMGFFMKKAFPNQTRHYMQQFKNFAEQS